MAIGKRLLLEFLEIYDDDAVNKAFKIYGKAAPKVIITGADRDSYSLEVSSESAKNKSYNVDLTVFDDVDIEDECDCPAMESYGECKHVAVAAIHILKEVHKFTLGEIKTILKDTELYFDGLDDNDIYDEDEEEDDNEDAADNSMKLHIVDSTERPAAHSGWKALKAAPDHIFYSIRHSRYIAGSMLKKCSLVSVNDDGPEAMLFFEYSQNKTTVYHPQINYDRRETFLYKCDCTEAGNTCSHVNTAFVLLNETYGGSYFFRYKNYDAEKNELLKPYGLTIADKEAAAIEFRTDQRGNLIMLPPPWLWKVDISDNLKRLSQVLTAGDKNGKSRPGLPEGNIIDFETGFLFNIVSQHFKIGFELEPLKVYKKNDRLQFKKLPLHQPANLPLLRALPDELYNLLLHISDEGIKNHFSKSDESSMRYITSWNQLDSRGLTVLKKYYAGELIKLWPHLCSRKHLYILKEKTFSNANIRPVKLSPAPVSFSFDVTGDERFFTIWLKKELDGQIIPEENIKLYSGFIFEINDKLHIPGDAVDIDMLWQFESGYIKMPVFGRAELVRTIIPMLQRRYKVTVPESLSINIINTEPLPQVMLKEIDNRFLVLQPQYTYDDVTVDYEPAPDNILITPPGRLPYIVERNALKEQEFFDSLRQLHPRFQEDALHNFFFVPFDETLKNNWFVETVARLVEDKIPVLGMQELTKHRYNTNKPKWEMKAGSGIDWFDLQVQISFGDQSVSLSEVRKALLNKQNAVLLGDGTFGLLPEEWLKQYGLLLKMGEIQGDGGLRVSKLHYTLIDELHSEIDNEEILREINEKKQRLLNIGNIEAAQPGEEINAVLRPYQLSGFQWLHTLDEIGWGGCLADDMGLGKTLQTITFLQYLVTKYQGSTHLVICPTSLIYNWESEIKKFAPALKYHIYYGAEREFTHAHFNDYDVVITSYGVLRNDLEALMQFDWHYIILDESQAIKNPDAQTNKALQLLKSKNRIILSGTPLQNNTYDLFAQFHFINPGLLGSREFFKTEFANPIDKNNDAEKTAQLRRLLYPFMLRRTKGQVATDLPDKTETILWCEMSKEQKAVYDDYKNHYRDTLLEKIAEVGMAKAGMYVLEGLLRLRQICDSPELVKNHKVKTKKSAKLDELLREIEENTGNHKMLVFSQFTEMLHLIEGKLRSNSINYTYLDGSTPAEKRKEAVQNFQNDPALRVFLISLKAGGVGLNLTAADYVYLVDPWWNPAVEQQAIDRTHRIGQSNKIFAYKMICKDTVEEKILQLQQRKKQLAGDLVTEDAGFIKKLTKDDVLFLFS